MANIDSNNRYLCTMRLPQSMYKQLLSDAMETGISLNAQICIVIKNYYEEREQLRRNTDCSE